MKTSISMVSATLVAALALEACNKPTTINPAPEVTPVIVPGPPGPAGSAGAQGMDGSKGEAGRAGDGTTVVVVPPVMPASVPASSTYSLTPRSTP